MVGPEARPVENHWPRCMQTRSLYQLEQSIGLTRLVIPIWTLTRLATVCQKGFLTFRTKQVFIFFFFICHKKKSKTKCAFPQHRTGAAVFCSEKKFASNVQSRDRFRLSASMWASLSATEKAPFSRKAKKKFERYTLDLHNWFLVWDCFSFLSFPFTQAKCFISMGARTWTLQKKTKISLYIAISFFLHLSLPISHTLSSFFLSLFLSFSFLFKLTKQINSTCNLSLSGNCCSSFISDVISKRPGGVFAKETQSMSNCNWQD